METTIISLSSLSPLMCATSAPLLGWCGKGSGLSDLPNQNLLVFGLGRRGKGEVFLVRSQGATKRARGIAANLVVVCTEWFEVRRLDVDHSSVGAEDRCFSFHAHLQSGGEGVDFVLFRRCDFQGVLFRIFFGRKSSQGLVFI